MIATRRHHSWSYLLLCAGLVALFLVGTLGSNPVTESIPLNGGISTYRDYGGESEVLLPQHTVSAYTPHGPITITSDADFASQGWPGNGTESNPYVVEGLSIAAGGNCISISDTTVCFVIRDCLLTGGNSGDGVSLENVIRGRVEGCVISEKSNGVYLVHSSNNSVVNNTISHNDGDGVLVFNSSTNSVVNNTISDNSGDGVSLFDSSTNNTVVNNTISQNYDDGIYLYDSSSGNSVVNNTISDNVDDGICLESSSNNCVVNNEFVNNGILILGTTLSDWFQTVTSNNTVNGKMLAYFTGLTGGVVDGSQYGQVILVNCTGVRVQDGLFVKSAGGIELAFSSSNILINNTISDNSDYGVYLYSATNNSVVNNTISDNGDGVYLGSSSGNSVVDNTISHNDDGVYLCSASDYNTVANNTISDNSNYGALLDSFTSNNQFYLNIFVGNDNNAGDYGSDNHWNTTGIGNYWSDYSGTGVYSIPGSAGSIDYHPRTWDVTPPSIDHPADVLYNEGTTGHSIIWSPSDAHPASYEIYRNGSLLDSGSWTGGSITVLVDNLAVGTYNFTIVVYDKSGNYASDTVFVTVRPGIATIPPLGLSMPVAVAVLLGSVAVVSVSAVAFVRRRTRIRIQTIETTETAPLLEPPVETGRELVKVYRGCEIVGGRFEYKVKVMNVSGTVITNVVVSIIGHPSDCMELVGSDTKKISRIEVGGFRSPQFIFVPTKDCVEGKILATVSFIDAHDNVHSIEVEPYVIRSVCDLLQPLQMSASLFDELLENLDRRTQESTLRWNPQVLYEKAKSLLPARNFMIIDSDERIAGGQFIGMIRGLAEGKYTRKKVAVVVTLIGPAEGHETNVTVEVLGEDVSMIPTTIEELTERIDSWICLRCGAPLPDETVLSIKAAKIVKCEYCGHSLSLDLYKK